jgi:hypothetical protein
LDKNVKLHALPILPNPPPLPTRVPAAQIAVTNGLALQGQPATAIKPAPMPSWVSTAVGRVNGQPASAKSSTTQSAAIATKGTQSADSSAQYVRGTFLDIQA